MITLDERIKSWLAFWETFRAEKTEVWQHTGTVIESAVEQMAEE